MDCKPAGTMLDTRKGISCEFPQWSMNKMADILQIIFSNIFSRWKIICSDWNITEKYQLVPPDHMSVLDPIMTSYKVWTYSFARICAVDNLYFVLRKLPISWLKFDYLLWSFMTAYANFLLRLVVNLIRISLPIIEPAHISLQGIYMDYGIIPVILSAIPWWMVNPKLNKSSIW